MKKTSRISRRKFLKITAGGATAAGVVPVFQPLATLAQSPAEPVGMALRPLGRTGVQVPLFSLGGQGLLEQFGHQEEAVAIINRAIDLGVTYCDTAHWYGKDGCSEVYYGEVMKTRRNEVYLATKTGERGYDGAMRDLETSLKRLQTDRLDCWQMHHIRTPEDLEKIFAPEGALKAFLKARDEKITRFIGITGHLNPFVLKDAIGRFDFDTILMALNAADRNLPGPGNESSFIDHLLPAAVEKNLGIIGMKIPAIGRIFKPDGLTSMDQALGYALSLPVSTVIIGIKTIAELEENIRIAQNFQPFPPEEMARLEALTKPYYADATFFKRQRGYA